MACLMLLTAFARLASDTNTPGQTRSSSSSFGSARGRCSTSSASSSNAFGGRPTGGPARMRLPAPVSRVQPAKRNVTRTPQGTADSNNTPEFRKTGRNGQDLPAPHADSEGNTRRAVHQFSSNVNVKSLDFQV